MKKIKIIDTKNVVGAGFKVSKTHEIPWSDIIFAGASIGLGQYFWPIIIPIVVYKYGYSITDFSVLDPVKIDNASLKADELNALSLT